MSEKLSKVLDLLIAEDREEAAKALNEWFAEQQATVTAQLMEAEEVEEELEEELDESEEVAEGEELEEGVTITIDADDDVAVAEADDEVVDDFGGEEVIGGDDEIVDADADAGFGGDEVADDSAVEDLTVDERVEDLEAQLEALRAEFASLMGDEAGDDVADDDAGEEEGEEEIVDGDSDEEETEGDDEVEEAIAPGVPGKKTTFSQKSGIDFGGHQRIREDEELEEDFADLEESADYKLEPVAAEKLKTEGETTGVGKKVKVTKDSPIPQRAPDERAGGDPVEIKGKTHKGYAREAAPTVLGGNEKFKNSQKAPKKISKEGDKSAVINKGPAPDKGKSPISGDPKLRGRDLSRK